MSLFYEAQQIESQLSCSASDFIADCEKQFHGYLCHAAELAFQREIVLLAGPSASGKTTSAALLAREIERVVGGRAYTVSLDDFYLNNGCGPKNADGSDDFETVYALDLDALQSCLVRLLTKREADLPMFDFVTGKRKRQTKKICLDKNDRLIIEGLHALNPLITGDLPKNELLLLYISVSSRVAENGGVLLSKRDLRFLRRLVRDARFRASSPENTFDLWQQVLFGEDRYLFPYEGNAQYKINSFLPYEPALFAAEAIPLLLTVDEDSRFYPKAQTLLAALRRFQTLSPQQVPADSILREFIG